MGTSAEERAALIRRLLPEGTPRLWCPLISHYQRDGSFDEDRTRAHFARLAPHVKGFLLPGSTGDGWEMDDTEIRSLLEMSLRAAEEFGFRLLIGVLKTEIAEVAATMDSTLCWLCERTGRRDTIDALLASRVCGFTVCPPKGKERSQVEIRAALETVLATGIPASLYQLPQVTENEMAPETVAALAADHGNFILFKDTSGADRVVGSGADLGGVFTVRGAEGGYAGWPRSNGGPYDGLLLSTANTFPGELARLLDLIETGETAAAEALSERLDRVVAEAFAAVGDLGFGNAFANANKAMDHVMAYGETASECEGPLTHSGQRVPRSVIGEVSGILAEGGFLPSSGYLVS